MSALDKCIEQANRNRDYSHCDHVTISQAREELAALRATNELGWQLVRARVSPGCDSVPFCVECGGIGLPILHNDGCIVAIILRTDPERASKMGLGWAL